MEQLLQQSKDRLLYPLLETRRLYLIVFNTFNTLLTLSFMFAGKVFLGAYVVAKPLIVLYCLSVLISFLTATYNALKLSDKNGRLSAKFPLLRRVLGNQKLDRFLAVISVILVLMMSLGGITGYGNPSSDAIITNFSFAHAMIVAIVIIIGRNWAFAWGLLVLGILFWNVNNLGWDFEYHYLTRAETARYEQALARYDPDALRRKAQLEKDDLAPSPITRYLRLWATFIVVAMFLAWFFGGIIVKTYNVIPSVVGNIEQSIQTSTRISMELEHKKNELSKSALSIVRLTNVVEQVNSELEKLDYSQRKTFLPVLKILRETLTQEEKEASWQSFLVTFDALHPGFWEQLQEQNPDVNLSLKELKHLAYIKMDLPSSEIAALLGVTVESLKSMRHKLKKKLNLSDMVDLKDFVNKIPLTFIFNSVQMII